MIRMIWAQSINGVIGNKGIIPWELPEDLRYFKDMTFGSTVVMGRHTWNSLPTRPLPGRKNIVISRLESNIAGALVIDSPEAVMEEYSDFWVVGGGRIYDSFMPHADELYVTTVHLVLEGDTHAPRISLDVFTELGKGLSVAESGISYTRTRYGRIK